MIFSADFRFDEFHFFDAQPPAAASLSRRSEEDDLNPRRSKHKTRIRERCQTPLSFMMLCQIALLKIPWFTLISEPP